MTSRRPDVRSRPGGFTLIELLVVVSIIALLVAILLPSLRKARDQAKTLKCMANLRSIGQALMTYADDNRQELPDYTGVGQYSFRIAPGRYQKTPLAGGDIGSSLFPEIFGVQTVLQTGSGVDPASPPDLNKRPVYLHGNSEVYVCPSNPGPRRPTILREIWKDLGNTYDFRVIRVTDSNKWLMNLDALRNRRDQDHHEILLVWDNEQKIPGRPGFLGPWSASQYGIQRESRVPPHRRDAANQSSNAQKTLTSSLACFLDGHVDWRPGAQD
jgi:prepilin-type N-terminal cleavage/methylation domain-containing protein